MAACSPASIGSTIKGRFLFNFWPNYFSFISSIIGFIVALVILQAQECWYTIIWDSCPVLHITSPCYFFYSRLLKTPPFLSLNHPDKTNHKSGTLRVNGRVRLSFVPAFTERYITKERLKSGSKNFLAPPDWFEEGRTQTMSTQLKLRDVARPLLPFPHSSRWRCQTTS